jgi:hypothetical protein
MPFEYAIFKLSAVLGMPVDFTYGDADYQMQSVNWLGDAAAWLRT